MIELDLSEIEPMAALPFHPSRACTIRELQKDPWGILSRTEEAAEKSLPDGVKLRLTD
jgi:aconitate hydratase